MVSNKVTFSPLLFETTKFGSVLISKRLLDKSNCNKN